MIEDLRWGTLRRRDAAFRPASLWVDAFARHMIPFHLTTVEFFAELRAHLASNGILVVNLASPGEGGDLLRANAVVQTMRRSFPNVESFAVKGPWKSAQSGSENLIFPVRRSSSARSLPLWPMSTDWFEQQRLPFEAIALLGTQRTQPWEAASC